MKRFKNLTEKEKTRIIGLYFLVMLIIIAIVWVFAFIKIRDSNIEEKANYTFYLNGENMSSILICENEWHYESLEGFVPCEVNGTVGGVIIPAWNISPQQICENVGGSFIGLNIYNDTRAKELYDELLPKCFELNEKEISYIWMNSSNCLCLDNNLQEFSVGCDEYDCSGGLIIKKIS